MVSQTLLNEAYPIIDHIAEIRKKNGAFAYYTNDDIFQEVWFMCLDALKRYDSSIGPLENYLVRHVANRLKNLKRDRYFRPGSDVETSGCARVRINLVNALSLNRGDIDSEVVMFGSNFMDVDPIQHIICNETLEYLRNNLSGELLDDFNDLLSSNKIRKFRIDRVRSKIENLLMERGDDGN